MDAELSTQEIEIFISTDAYLVTTQTTEAAAISETFYPICRKIFL